MYTSINYCYNHVNYIFNEVKFKEVQIDRRFLPISFQIINGLLFLFYTGETVFREILEEKRRE